MTADEIYMHRCLQLAQLGAGRVAPNPLVGSVLVHNGRIIGEGYHRQYGEAHAEVNCIASVREADWPLIPESTIYVSLEPCAHFGKTPPCADLIIRKGIRKVVIGCRDPFKAVDGKGIEKLQQAGIEVVCGVLEKECQWLNRRFFTFHTQHRPFILLKWAQTANGKIAAAQTQRLLISDAVSNRLVHRWRSEEMAILVGTRTALLDNPSLTNRLWHGHHPVRLVVDMGLQLPATANIFSNDAPVIVFNELRHSLEPGMQFPVQVPACFYYQVSRDASLVHQILNACYQLRLQSILVEGGARLLQSFIDEDCWDEARIITNPQLFVEQGLPAPSLQHQQLYREQSLVQDKVHTFVNQHQPYFPYRT